LAHNRLIDTSYVVIYHVVSVIQRPIEQYWQLLTVQKWRFQGYVSRSAADGFPMLNSTPLNFHTRIPHIPAALGTATIEKQEVLPQLFLSATVASQDLTCKDSSDGSYIE
jgi:hypothetical protein